MASLPTLFALAGCWLLLGNGWLYLRFRSAFRALWREPVLCVPVVIIESDDWGAGPAEQADLLRRLRHLLGRHADACGRRPVMTLGLTLASPDARALAADTEGYARRMLDHPDHAAILAEIRQGIADGVFAAQLHGTEHFMPAVVCEVASSEPEVRDWLVRGDQYSELLPARLQSRWIDARRLPSTEHSRECLEAEVAAEVAAFRRLFGVQPGVVVPNTFAWTQAVEVAWARHGLRYLVTCGRRFVARDAAERLRDDGAELRNGERSNGLVCLVRDAYFEPAKGHTAADALALLPRYSDCGRPLLFETHRSNFTTLNPAAEQAFAALDELLAELLRVQPRLRFLSTQELGDALVDANPEFVSQRRITRLRAWLCRVRQLPGFVRHARLCGADLLISLLLSVLRPQAA